MKALNIGYSHSGTKHIYLRNYNGHYPSPTICGNWNPPSAKQKPDSTHKTCKVCESVLNGIVEQFQPECKYGCKAPWESCSDCS